MPLYAMTCDNGHAMEAFCHHREDRGTRTHICPCGSTMRYTLSMGAGLTWFEEGRGRWITNLGDKPIYVTSHEQHKREMRKAGVDWATGWALRCMRARAFP